MNAPAATRLDDLHAVVTGGGRGIGAAIATGLASRGARVTVLGRTASALEGVAQSLRNQFDARVHVAVCDVADQDDVRRAFSGAVAELGTVRILINNAGQADAAPFSEISLESWNRILAVNMTGTFLCTQQVLPGMIAARSGRVLNIASTAGLKAYARTAAYTAAKHGVVGLTRAVAAETARTGITVNAICPGYTEGTGMFTTAVENVMRSKGVTADEAKRTLARHSPRGSLVTVGEIVATVLWLCSPDASAIHGQAIAVAAGEVM
jgi:NAD(P)-dependent dehydrogenase (short-subunit alcohol dehydrogenase family)